MIILSAFFLILLILISVACFIVPFCIFLAVLHDNIAKSLYWGKRFPFGATIEFALALILVFFISAGVVLGLSSKLYFLWNPEKRSEEFEKSRKVLIELPENVQLYTEFRLDDTVIGKEVL